MSRNALSLPLTLLAILGLAAFAGCANESNFEPDPTRGPLGKADNLSNTCQDSCGEKSAGSCWCDENCSFYGDCCDDKAAICDAPQLTACGGFLGDTCDADQYCQFEDSAICGWADASGVCSDTPEVCIQIFAPVCGCDGETYSNSCFANAAGTSVSADGPCDPPPAGPVDSCEESCGGQSNSGSCYCDDSCAGYGDCCGDYEDLCAAEPGREPASGMCIKNSNDTCQTDADCNAGGCGGALCFNPAVSSGISTCECTTPTTVSGCGCVEGSCTWYNE